MMDYYFNEEEFEVDDSIKTEEEIENWKQEYNFGPNDQLDMRSEPFFRTLNIIFGHLSLDELLNLSIVSKNWQKVIGKLEAFTSRSKLKITEITAESVNALKNSERIYNHIDMTVWNLKDDKVVAHNVICKNAAFLKSLKFIKFGGHNQILNDSLNMPNLKELEVQVIGGRMKATFFEDVTTLEKLTINGVEPEGLKNCFRNNANLTELILYENSFIGYFRCNISKSITFKLKKLKVLDHINQRGLVLKGEFPAEPWTSTVRMNFLKFLSTQVSLVSLHLDMCYAEDLPKIVSTGSLELLEINGIRGRLETPKTFLDNNIEIFVTKMENINSAIIVDLLKFMPNIQTLFIQNIYEESFFEIVMNENCQDLQNFFYDSASNKATGEASDLKKLYRGHINVNQSSEDEFLHVFGPED